MELVAVFDKFPDMMEVYRESEANSKPILKFVVFRKNSRSFTSDQRQALDFMVEAGLNVVVRVGRTEMSLDEFDMGGAYAAAPNKLVAQSTYYNKQSEMRRLEATLNSMAEDAPERYEIGKRIQNIKTMLGISDQATISADALKKSDEALKKIEQLARIEMAKGLYHTLSEEDLAKVPINKITAAMVNDGDKTISSKWMIARCKQRVIQLTAELTLQPDSIELRSKIIAEEDAIKEYQEKLESVKK